MEHPGNRAADAPRRQRRAPTRGSWRKGESGNPGGRPRSAFALTTYIRETVDPAELVTIALTIARTAPQESVKLQALQWLRDSGFVRPAERHEVVAGLADDDAEDYTGLSLEQLAELETNEQRRAEIFASRATAMLVGGDQVQP